MTELSMYAAANHVLGSFDGLHLDYIYILNIKLTSKFSLLNFKIYIYPTKSVQKHVGIINPTEQNTCH